MLRIILGVLAGFALWSIVWVGTDAFLVAISPDWFGKNFNEFQNAVSRNEIFESTFAVCAALILLGVGCSLISGFAAALIAKENRKSTVTLGFLLLVTGVFVEVAHWKYFPVWYHILFLLLLVPVTVAGGKLKRFRT